MGKTGIITDKIFLEHDTGSGHPESKFRLESILQYLESKNYSKDLRRYDTKIPSEEDILKIHSADHYNRIKALSGKKGYLDGDTPYSEKSSEAALRAVGAGLEIADKIINLEVENGMVMFVHRGIMQREITPWVFVFLIILPSLRDIFKRKDTKKLR